MEQDQAPTNLELIRRIEELEARFKYLRMELNQITEIARKIISREVPAAKENPAFRRKLLIDISADDISKVSQHRKKVISRYNLEKIMHLDREGGLELIAQNGFPKIFVKLGPGTYYEKEAVLTFLQNKYGDKRFV